VTLLHNSKMNFVMHPWCTSNWFNKWYVINPHGRGQTRLYYPTSNFDQFKSTYFIYWSFF